MNPCPSCGNSEDILGLQYDWDHPEHCDGISEWHCPCGTRWGAWSNAILAEGECEPRYGIARNDPPRYNGVSKGGQGGHPTQRERNPLEVATNRSPQVENQNTPTDFLGNSISVGDAIVYPNRKGSKMWMNNGRVTGITNNDGDVRLRVRRDDGTTRVVSCLDRVVVVTAVVESAALAN